MWDTVEKAKSANRLISTFGNSAGSDARGPADVSRVAHRTAGLMAHDSLYLPVLDGLRFIAFLLVFLHHLPRTIVGFATIARVGWAGVDIFFALSSFLLFYLLGAEQKSRGDIDLPKFYGRRLLRVYPLMVLFPLAMLAIFGGFAPRYYTNVAGNVFGIENFLVWFRGYSQLPYSAHLWSLSYELQMYVVLPLAFLIYRSAGQRFLLRLLMGIWLVSLGARATFLFTVPAASGVIWVAPFLRPESTLIGIALAVLVLNQQAKLSPSLVMGFLVAASVALIAGPDISARGLWQLALYPICASIAGALLWLALHADGFRWLLSRRVPRYLGKISYGLYVYHLLGIYLALVVFRWFGVQQQPEDFAYYMSWLVLALALTIMMAAASYRFIESPFLHLKARFELVKSRPI
jgi:peptidoglycan/LPS O-acetylase OafA/YrhL